MLVVVLLYTHIMPDGEAKCMWMGCLSVHLMFYK